MWRMLRARSRKLSMKFCKHIAVFIAILFLSGCATHVPRPNLGAAGSDTAASAIQAWTDVLVRFVNERGEVDFAALSDDRKALERYVHFIAVTPPDSFPAGNARLAHFINSYNALSMYNVIDLGIPESNASTLAKAKFFILRKFEIGGVQMSLYAYENEIIRKLGEPRIHWALNCSARSCPVLPKKPFSAENLEAELESEAKKFFAESKNLRIDHAAKEIWLTEIFQLFPEDFVPKFASSFVAYAQRFVTEKLPTDYRERFTPYDWTIASSKKK
jgi:Protein of unknown function, DUF547